MKLFTKSKDKRTELEKERDAAIEDLRNTPWSAEPEFDEYGNPKKDLYEEQLKRIERLNELIGDKASKGISPDTALLVAANLLGIILIISHEKVNVISSKALGLVLRGRV